MSTIDVNMLRSNFSDGDTLANICKKAFDHISEEYSKRKEGPSGYDDPHWHIMSMKEGVYFKIMHHDTIIGAILIALRCKKRENGKTIFHWELVQMFIDPKYQGMGVGRFAVKEIENYFPEMYLFTVGTPTKYIRNNDFYKKLGFNKVKELVCDDVLFSLYEKKYNIV